MPGIGLITNPRSRANRRDPAGMRRLAYLVGSRGESAATKSVDDLYRVAEEFKAAEIDVLGINGGDGTIHLTLTACLQVWNGAPFPKVAILRGGTMNTIANALGIKGRGATPERLLYATLDDYHAGVELKTIRRSVLRVNDAYGFIFGNGVLYNFLDAYYATGKASPWTAAKLLARAALSAMVRGPLARRLLARFRAHVLVDGVEWARDDFVAVGASTVAQLGLGFAPFHRCTEKPGSFAVLGIHTTPLGIVLDLPRIRRGVGMRRHKAISEVAREVVFDAEEPFGYTIDGDTYKGQSRVTVATGPELELVIPDLSS